MGILNNSNAISVDSGYDITDSLRFRASASAYLSRTPTVAGNRKTWTWSGWVKRGKLGATQVMFGSQTNSSNTMGFLFLSGDTLHADSYVSGGLVFALTTNRLFRDSSAWYHVMLVIDTTQATASNRVKMYVNGTQESSFATATYPSLNTDLFINQTNPHSIGNSIAAATEYLDGYLTEVNFVDGTAKAPSDFGETDDNGTWIPKKYTGSYGTNGFYLPMKPTTQATGFNTVLYTGNGGTQSITGVGFTPDLVWVKNRDESGRFNLLTDTIRGATKSLASNLTSAESGTTYSNGLTAFGTDGFSVGSLIDFNGSADKMVAWCWDAGGSTVTNTNGTINSQVRANPSTGFSIATWTNESSGDDTVGHGLGVAPKLIITKLRSTSGDWYTQTTAIDGGLDYLKLNDTNAAASLPKALPTADVFTTDMGGTTTAVAYCFADVTGYQKIGSYTGNGSTTGPSVTGLGFQPAWILIKSTSIGDEWVIFDNTRNPSNPTNLRLNPNSDGTEQSSQSVNILSDGFQPITTGGNINQSGATYIYMAIADTRDAKFNFDASGNKNNWTPNNINSNASGESTYDLMSDVPTLTDEDTANFAVMNPLDNALGASITNGNLQVTSSGSSWKTVRNTLAMPAGSWYAELTSTVGIGNGNSSIGIVPMGVTLPQPVGEGSATSWGYSSNGNIYNNGSVINATGSAWSAGATVALTFDGSTLKFYNAGVLIATISSIPANTYAVGGSFYGDNAGSFNFGQQPFAYTPPTGSKKLNTFNLPDSTITDGSEHFDIQLWTGDNANPRSFSNTAFSPDFVWYKSRNNAYYHNLYDSVRGVTRALYSNDTSAEYVNDTSGTLKSFDSDGFTVGGDTDVTTVNGTGQTYVGWQWRGSDSTAASIASGSIDGTNPTIASTVSANTTAGFSIVTYTGTGSNATVGHGLGVAPKFLIVKGRDAAEGWTIQSQILTGNTNGTFHFNTDAEYTGSSTAFQGTVPTSTVFSIGTAGNTNSNTQKYVAYCFAEVDGYSKMGTYTGNGSADGPFIYTGFRPAFIMFRSTSLCNWVIVDSARSTFNVMDDSLYPNTSGSEITTITDVDFLSNGFKWRANLPNETNASGQTYVYMAFAENPFKNSNAR